MTKIRLSSDELLTLHARHIAGETIAEIARSLNCSRNRLYHLFPRHGLPIYLDRFGRGKNRRGVIEAHIPRATIHPTITQLAWAAGFLEGEGCFRSESGTARCSACQNNPEPILKLQSMFGGPVTTRRIEGNSLSQNPITEWRVSGVLARGIMMTLYSFMSEARRTQIRHALFTTRRQALAER